MLRKSIVSGLVLLAVCVCSCAVLLAQEDKSVAVAKMVTAVEVNGNKSISINTILSKLKTRVGSPFQESIISDDLKRLYLMEYFSDIKIDSEPYKDGVKVIITVAERPIIEKISFSGNRRSVSDERLKEALKSKETQYLDHPRLSEDVDELKKLYIKKGYGQVQAEYNVKVDEATNKAKVEFKLDEGRRQRIKRIYVEGNLNFSDRKILGIMKTKRAWLFNSGVMKEDVLKEDMDRVRAFYRKNGFIDVTVDNEYTIDPRRRFIYITVKISEGKKYLVGTVSVRGNQDIAETEILGRIKQCTPGKVYNDEALKEDIMNIQGLYFDRGYISASVQDNTSVNSFTERIDIVFSITENQIAYVNKVSIRGNVKTRDVVIRREMRIKPGERFDGDKLRRSKERLQNLGFFEEVSYDTEDTEEPQKKDLIVEVKEAKTGMFSFGGGYSTVDQFVGFIEVEQKNFDWKNWPYFTGAGQDLKLRASMGSLSQGYDLSFTEPWLFDYPVSFGFDLYKRTHERESDVGYGYDEDVTGGDLRLGKEISEYLRADMTYRYDDIDISDVSADATQDLKDEAGTNVISSLEYGMTFDSRDNVFNPTRGNILGGSFMWAGGPFGGDKEFWKFFGTAAHYTGMFSGSVLESKVRTGLADTYDDTAKIPIFERFFAGGSGTVRGYRERKVGPVDASSGDPLGGESLLVGNLEYTYPIVSFFKLATFYDIGNVWTNMQDITLSDLKSGTGLGVRLKTPIGPLSLDYGIPLNKESGEDKRGGGRFHFSMSHGF